ncbi:hypothetical protein SARC_05563 [Sphaeroforma arctica JP610]|uniref:Uncharacterized protein n=1 Tax=Sphaeroforma arctica JP610 TaxID=667725 RepID=A0A0L0G1T1_9EUKA|nr:hypothetical protein SARC_05563 [Sphaeroforma arctica JP610]KNC82143.1 hypothetical protein SARC_05563 [Sphaeroforma arctica JP610]|eukprot:XP_014156045.1 hypothetical protein SARC_05563 [Sphaeroforma arctica JP610]
MNSIVERQHATLNNLVRCLLLENDIPLPLWGFAKAFADTLRNRTPPRNSKLFSPSCSFHTCDSDASSHIKSTKLPVPPISTNKAPNVASVSYLVIHSTAPTTHSRSRVSQPNRSSTAEMFNSSLRNALNGRLPGNMSPAVSHHRPGLCSPAGLLLLATLPLISPLSLLFSLPYPYRHLCPQRLPPSPHLRRLTRTLYLQYLPPSPSRPGLPLSLYPHLYSRPLPLSPYPGRLPAITSPAMIYPPFLLLSHSPLSSPHPQSPFH